MQMEREHVSQHYESQTWCQNKVECFQKLKKHSQKSNKKYQANLLETREKQSIHFGELTEIKDLGFWK